MVQRTEHGELVYEYTAKLTGFTEYGASMLDLMQGRIAPPPTGLRVDISFEGEVRGRLGGYIKGVDYLNIRPDGRMELDIRAVIETPTGERISVTAGGVGLPQPDGLSLLRENVKLTTAYPEYSWVNVLEFWAAGEADVAKGEVHLRGYIPQ